MRHLVWWALKYLRCTFVYVPLLYLQTLIPARSHIGLLKFMSRSTEAYIDLNWKSHGIVSLPRSCGCNKGFLKLYLYFNINLNSIFMDYGYVHKHVYLYSIFDIIQAEMSSVECKITNKSWHILCISSKSVKKHQTMAKNKVHFGKVLWRTVCFRLSCITLFTFIIVDKSRRY